MSIDPKFVELTADVLKLFFFFNVGTSTRLEPRKVTERTEPNKSFQEVDDETEALLMREKCIVGRNLANKQPFWDPSGKYKLTTGCFVGLRYTCHKNVAVEMDCDRRK